MPNGGSDCCGTCWFNRTNRGHRDWLEHQHESIPPYCEIRDLALEDPFYTYCANHPHRRPDRDPIPIGPVVHGWDRELLQPSPDTPEIRQHLLDLLDGFPRNFEKDWYPIGSGLDESVILQLGRFGERRAIRSLERLAADSPDFLADAARTALARIRGNG